VFGSRLGGARDTLTTWFLLPIVLLLVYFLIPLRDTDAPAGVWAGSLVAVLGLVGISWVILSEAASARKRLRLVHLVLALELVLLIFSLAYYVLAVDQPTEFVGLHTRLDALYFSMVTVTTVGYGDVSAHGQVARALVTCQLAFNLVFVGALVGLFQTWFQDRSVSAERSADVDVTANPSEAGETTGAS
jgi:hypothetical protein